MNCLSLFRFLSKKLVFLIFRLVSLAAPKKARTEPPARSFGRLPLGCRVPYAVKERFKFKLIEGDEMQANSWSITKGDNMILLENQIVYGGLGVHNGPIL